MRIRANINVEVNRIVKFFVLSDFFFIAGWGFIEPIFSVFIIQKLPGATLTTVGIAFAIYWILRSILQIPFANFLDRRTGEQSAFRMLIAGLFLAALSAFAFGWVTQIWELYAVQIIHAIALSLYTASWPAIFSRHLDKTRISFDWSLDNTAVGIGSGVSGFLAGVIGATWGFTAVFILAGILSLVGAVIILTIPKIVLPPDTTTTANRQDKATGSIGI